MKKTILGMAMGCAMILAACENQIANEAATDVAADVTKEKELMDVTFSVMNFEQTLIQMGVSANTRAALAGNATHLKVALFIGDTKRYEFAQTSEDSGFGTITAQVVPEDYDLVVIASKAEMTIESPTNIHPTGDKLTDTFYYYGALTKATLEGGSVPVSLSRAVARFDFLTDAKPTEVKKIALEMTGGSATFNAVTGLGAGSTTRTSTISLSSLAANANIYCGMYTFLPAADNNVSVKVTVYDADEKVVKTHTFTGVQMKPGYITNCSGNFFQIDGSWTITIGDVSWPANIEVPYDLSSL